MIGPSIFAKASLCTICQDTLMACVACNSIYGTAGLSCLSATIATLSKTGVMAFRKDGWLVIIRLGYAPCFRSDYSYADIPQFRSTQRLKQLVRTTRGRVIPGHDEGTFNEIKREKEVYT